VNVGHGGEKRILYYVDPMHPSYRSAQPGTAPDCGMPLEPVYEGEDPGAKLELMPGAIALDAHQSRLIGVRTEVATRGSGKRVVRTTGKVQPDPGRDFVITAGSGGYVHQLGDFPEGTLVRRGQVLATYVARDARAAQQSFLAALSRTEWRADSRDSVNEATPNGSALSVAREQLRLMGMTEDQIRDLARTRVVTTEIDVASPTDGIVLARYITPEQRFDKGKDLFRIVDLSRVWIVADLYGEEAEELHPGARVRATVRDLGKVIHATVSDAPALFDPMTRTLKLRLEAANSGMVLRPGMFVDLEFDEEPTDDISVRADAILDSGTRRIVYVESSPGVYEPRTVETGESFGDRVLVRRGLAEGDRVVTSGTFMIDSESRMRSASPQGTSGDGEDGKMSEANGTHPAAGSPAQAGPRDPVCGMAVDSVGAVAAKHAEKHGARTYVFCSASCLQRFRADPAQYVAGDMRTARGPVPAAPKR
jgi:Cu(I)/Ag(I) efflux system membrane fusion protein